VRLAGRNRLCEGLLESIDLGDAVSLSVTASNADDGLVASMSEEDHDVTLLQDKHAIDVIDVDVLLTHEDRALSVERSGLVGGLDGDESLDNRDVVCREGSPALLGDLSHVCVVNEIASAVVDEGGVGLGDGGSHFDGFGARF